jgi:hypothetical protein
VHQSMYIQTYSLLSVSGPISRSKWTTAMQTIHCRRRSSSSGGSGRVGKAWERLRVFLRCLGAVEFTPATPDKRRVAGEVGVDGGRLRVPRSTSSSMVRRQTRQLVPTRARQTQRPVDEMRREQVDLDVDVYTGC